MRAFRAVSSFLFVLCIPLALLTSTIRFVANEPRIYIYAVDSFDAPDTTGVERAELLRASSEIRRYFNDGEETLQIRVAQGDREISLFNERETAHMKDVKERFTVMNHVQEFSVLYLIVYVAAVVLWGREITTRRLAIQTALGALVVLVGVALAGVIGAAGFDGAWRDFHEVLFTNDLWLLNPSTDHLIQMFPPEFWQNIVFFIGLLTAAEAAFLLIGAGIYFGASRHAESRRMSPYYV